MQQTECFDSIICHCGFFICYHTSIEGGSFFFQQGLLAFADQLKDCQNVLETIGYLDEINSTDNLGSIVNQLSFHLKDNIQESGQRPRIHPISKFISAKAQAANNPVFGSTLNSDLDKGKQDKSSHKDSSNKKFVTRLTWSHGLQKIIIIIKIASWPWEADESCLQTASCVKKYTSCGTVKNLQWSIEDKSRCLTVWQLFQSRTQGRGMYAERWMLHQGLQWEAHWPLCTHRINLRLLDRKLVRETKHQPTTKHKSTMKLQYCAKVIQMNFDKIPGFSGLFHKISCQMKFWL